MQEHLLQESLRETAAACAYQAALEAAAHELFHKLALEVERGTAAASAAASSEYAAVRVQRHRSAHASPEALGALMAPAALFVAPISTMLRQTMQRCVVVL